MRIADASCISRRGEFTPSANIMPIIVWISDRSANSLSLVKVDRSEGEILLKCKGSKVRVASISF